MSYRGIGSDIGHTHVWNGSQWVSQIGGSGDGYVTIITPDQLTVDTDDYVTTGLDSADVVRLDGYDGYGLDADRTITGIDAPVAAKELMFVNIGTNSLVFNHDDTDSAAENRILIAGGSALTIPPNGILTLLYDDISAKWRVT